MLERRGVSGHWCRARPGVIGCAVRVTSVWEFGDRRSSSGGSRGGVGQPNPAVALGDGDVRARRGHVADERVDLGGHPRPRHDCERRAVGDRARGAGLGCVHPHQQQGRRPHRPQARLRARPPRVRRRRARDDRSRRTCPTIIIFWAIIGGLGASLLLPAMQSLIHGNFEGAAQKKAYALVGAPPPSPPRSARCSAASSRRTCRGGSASSLEVVIIAVVLSRIRLVKRRPVHRPAAVRCRRRRAVRRRHGRRRARDPRVAGRWRAVVLAHRARRGSRSRRSRWWLVKRKRAGQADPARP